MALPLVHIYPPGVTVNPVTDVITACGVDAVDPAYVIEPSPDLDYYLSPLDALCIVCSGLVPRE